ncbi:hypothetical protein NI389_14070 [Pseudoalteromonas xiamenensis]|uniref:hypothetical protein n=1 Tax=Pseudoalteromonas xiamenensis TaxID=882626 RepID=UPI0027E496B6|nr:hypothetical protein [Pseudoalteromonas xiamenensis]WMN59326.1 hypothetical protein NI389_14070 [Pseudoalteromonas xiamenensis]
MTVSAYRIDFSNNNPSHKWLVAWVVLTCPSLLFLYPTLSSLVLVIAGWIPLSLHTWKSINQWFIVDGVVVLNDGHIEIYDGQGVVLMGRLLPTSRIFDGLVVIYVQSVEKKTCVCFLPQSLQQEAWRLLRRTILSLHHHP